MGDHPSLKSGNRDSTFRPNRNLVVRPILEIHPNGQGNIVCLIVLFFFLFLFLQNFDHCVFPMFFENEIYLIVLTLGLLCCALCRCQVEVVVVGASTGLITLRRARL